MAREEGRAGPRRRGAREDRQEHGLSDQYSTGGDPPRPSIDVEGDASATQTVFFGSTQTQQGAAATG